MEDEVVVLKPQWGVNKTGEWLIDYMYHIGIEKIGDVETKCLCNG